MNKSFNKLYMPKTGVEVVIPEGVEVMVIADKDANKDVGELECAIGVKGSVRAQVVRFSYPVVVLTENLKELPTGLRKAVAVRTILEIAKAAGFDVSEVEESLDKMEAMFE